jgi:hypothetical protein
MPTAESASGADEEWNRGELSVLRASAFEGDTRMPAPDRYPINAEELARRLRVNAKSLRVLLRKRDLVPGHVKHTEYRIYRDAERAIWRHPDVQGLLRL